MPIPSGFWSFPSVSRPLASLAGATALLLAFGAAGCGERNTSVETGTGGTTMSDAGTTGSGGQSTSGTGGQPSSGSGGQAAGTGGAPASTGGAPGLGGAVSSGGSVASGGATNTGGKAATGGSTGLGGRPVDGGMGNDASAAGAPGTGGNNTGGSSGASGGGSGGGATMSGGCTKTSMLKNNGYNTIGSRQYYLRLPANYDNKHPYRLILGLHGANGKGTDVAPGFWGLYALSKDSTIFIAPDAAGGLWSAASDTTFVNDILKAVEADLCIDTSRIMLEGFSQGAAMSWTLACSNPGVFRAVVGHSGGGVANPSTCMPVAYLGSGGLQENVTQTSQSDKFAKWNGCTAASLPTAPKGGHVCTSYTGCPTAYPVRWCNFDGPHTPSPTDSGTNTSWMPAEAWPFFSQF